MLQQCQSLSPKRLLIMLNKLVGSNKKVSHYVYLPEHIASFHLQTFLKNIDYMTKKYIIFIKLLNKLIR